MQSLVSITFDDGLRCQFEKAVPILDRYGIPATFFLVANRDPTHEAWNHKNDWWKIDWSEADIANLKNLIKAGHEVGSHSVTHHPDKMQDNPLFEARESKERIEGWLETEVTSFCYPYYRSHAYLADAVKNAGYEQARWGADASYYVVDRDPSFDRFKVDSRQISANEKVSQWMRPCCWHILTFHAIGNGTDGWEPITKDRFAALMAELAKSRDDGAVEILTFENGAARLRQTSWNRVG
jgi:peptidoglycan/xylan/chitin deacetylase (PgdA/CDA1 family)